MQNAILNWFLKLKNNFLAKIVSEYNLRVYGQKVKPLPGLVRKDVCKRDGEEIKYPLPCGFCNMLAQDENLSMDDAEEVGLVYRENGKLVQKYHFPNCPRIQPVMNAKGALQSAGIIE